MLLAGIEVELVTGEDERVVDAGELAEGAPICAASSEQYKSWVENIDSFLNGVD
jgi:hypothetical protein